MKSFLLLLGLALLSCDRRGDADLVIRGDEDLLPKELLGIRVWSLDVGHGERVRISILNNSVTTTYYTKTGVIEGTSIKGDVLWENDSLILLRK